MFRIFILWSVNTGTHMNCVSIPLPQNWYRQLYEKRERPEKRNLLYYIMYVLFFFFRIVVVFGWKNICMRRVYYGISGWQCNSTIRTVYSFGIGLSNRTHFSAPSIEHCAAVADWWLGKPVDNTHTHTTNSLFFIQPFERRICGQISAGERRKNKTITNLIEYTRRCASVIRDVWTFFIETIRWKRVMTHCLPVALTKWLTNEGGRRSVDFFNRHKFIGQRPELRRYSIDRIVPLFVLWLCV